ncbi:MAG: type II toxin-antitoxin system VapC family toxin [Acetobacteraceae bacterium]|nr:type II toxin-antitoxin system VapC family toxin [Acetobacteraceae bacterium]
MTLLDANVVIDAFQPAATWHSWCWAKLASVHTQGPVAVNEVVFAEVSVGHPSADALDDLLASLDITFLPTPKPALVLAAGAHLAYRRRGGTRTGVLPDFFVGAQAVTENAALLTRDPKRYRTDFPGIRLIHP